MAKRITGIIPIEGEVMFARIYKLYNIIDEKVYIGSTYNTLVRRMCDHMHSYNCGESSDLYKHMLEIGNKNFRMKLLDYKIVDNVQEMRTLEQKWIDRENPKNLLNTRRATK